MRISHALSIGCFVLAASPAFAQTAPPAAPPSAPAAANPAPATGTPTTAADAAAEAAADEVDDDKKAWSLGVSVGTRIGQGTFANVSNDTEYTDPNCVDPIIQGCVGEAGNAFDRVQMSYGVSGSYTLADFTFSTGLSLSHWLTPGGGINRPHEVRLNDSGLGIGYKGWKFEKPGINVVPSLGLQFPTSKFSRVQTLVLGTDLGVSVSKQFFDRLGLAVSVGVGKNFHTYTTPLLDVERLERELDAEQRAALGDQVRPEAAVFRASEEVRPGLVAIGGINTEWSLSGGISGNWAIWKKLSMSASYRLSTSWSYALEDNPDVVPQGDYIQGRRGVGQGFSTSVGLSYPVQINDVSLGFSLGIGTAGYPKTSDNKSFRFPFWNTSGAAANASAVRFGVSARY